MLTQHFESPDGLFTLEYPRVWDMEEHENIPAFFDPISGNGAMQVLAVDTSFFNHDALKKEKCINTYPYLNGSTLKDKMIIFLHIQQIQFNKDDLKVYTRDNLIYIPYEYYIQGRFFIAVLMESQNVILLAVYNSAAQPNQTEAAIIGDILKSIQIKNRRNENG